MNLADAIRRASEKASDESAAKAWIPSQALAPPASREEPRVEPAEMEEAVEEPRFEASERLKEHAFPEPPTVSSGNVVRLELFLNSEQMTGLLKAILAGQHSVLTLKEAAAYLRVSPGSVQEMAEQGDIPGVMVNGAWRFPKASLDEWMALSAVKRLGSQLEDVEDVA